MYCRAVLPNAGLGNKLFPWARCRVFSLEHGVEMLAPRWAQLKFGPLLRRDRDIRLYHDLFKPRTPGCLSGLRAWWTRLSTTRVVDEPADLHETPVSTASNQIVVFKGAKDHFGALTGWDEVLLEEIRAMTRGHWLRRADALGEVAVGIHVRRGDFVEASSEQDFVLRGAIRTPLEWFIRSLVEVRERCGIAVPAVVVSDASDQALAELLQEEGVTRADTGSAIGDLLILSKAHLLIASGGSSFSAWAAFLGQMPTVSYPGQSLSWFTIVPVLGQYVGEWSHRDPIPQLLAEHIQALRHPAGRLAC
jgi:Glycosyl transferase family 11